MKKRRKPRRTIDEGLKTIFRNGESSQGSLNRSRKAQHMELGMSARKQFLVDNIDAWAMWLAPPVFLMFNIIYWVSFRHVGQYCFDDEYYRKNIL